MLLFVIVAILGIRLMVIQNEYENNKDSDALKEKYLSAKSTFNVMLTIWVVFELFGVLIVLF